MNPIWLYLSFAGSALLQRLQAEVWLFPEKVEETGKQRIQAYTVHFTLFLLFVSSARRAEEAHGHLLSYTFDGTFPSIHCFDMYVESDSLVQTVLLNKEVVRDRQATLLRYKRDSRSGERELCLDPPMNSILSVRCLHSCRYRTYRSTCVE